MRTYFEISEIQNDRAEFVSHHRQMTANERAMESIQASKHPKASDDRAYTENAAQNHGHLPAEAGMRRNETNKIKIVAEIYT